MAKSPITISVKPQDDKLWREAVSRLVTLGGVAGVRVGFDSNSTNEDGQNIAEYAAKNEFGAPGIPSRPFLRSTLRDNLSKWASLFISSTRGRWIKEKNMAKRAFTMVGRMAQVDVKAKILSNVPPPNAPEYAAKKKKKGGGYTGTLFNTGAMYRAVHFSLVDRNGNVIE
jgi:hypothetical protein